MTWLDEWKLMMEQREEVEPEYDFGIYTAVRDLCQHLKVVYQVSIYNEYIKWEDEYGHLYRVIDGSLSPSLQHLLYFASHSETIRLQKEEMKRIVELEQFAQKNKIHFHDDSIIEKIELAAHYARLRGWPIEIKLKYD
jgi:hypothetical protein